MASIVKMLIMLRAGFVKNLGPCETSGVTGPADLAEESVFRLSRLRSARISEAD